jgi:hypothetical protein
MSIEKGLPLFGVLFLINNLLFQLTEFYLNERLAARNDQLHV